jgi:hypothetical protein
MADVEHSALHATANQHALHRWAPADQATRFALVVVAGDRGKMAWQLSDNTFWILRDHANVGNANGWRQADDSAALTAAAAALAAANEADDTADAAQATANAAAPQTRTLTASTGLTGGGDLTADRSFACDFGSASGKVCEGNDARLSDARTPTSHASSHIPSGADAVIDVAAGANLTDADQTLQWSNTQGYHKMVASTTSAARAKTLGTTNAVDGSTYILDIYSQGHDVTIVNGGPAAGTIHTATAGTKVRFVVRFDGTNWFKGARIPLA